MASQVEVDPQETREWLEALDAVVNADGPQRAQFLLERVVGDVQDLLGQFGLASDFSGFAREMGVRG